MSSRKDKMPKHNYKSFSCRLIEALLKAYVPRAPKPSQPIIPKRQRHNFRKDPPEVLLQEIPPMPRRELIEQMKREGTWRDYIKKREKRIKHQGWFLRLRERKRIAKLIKERHPTSMQELADFLNNSPNVPLPGFEGPPPENPHYTPELLLEKFRRYNWSIDKLDNEAEKWEKHKQAYDIYTFQDVDNMTQTEKYYMSRFNKLPIPPMNNTLQTVADKMQVSRTTAMEWIWAHYHHAYAPETHLPTPQTLEEIRIMHLICFPEGQTLITDRSYERRREIANLTNVPAKAVYDYMLRVYNAWDDGTIQ